MKRIPVIKAIIDKNGYYSHNAIMFINDKICNYNSSIKNSITKIANSNIDNIEIHYISRYKRFRYTLYNECDELDTLGLEDYSNEIIKTGFKFKDKRKKISDYTFIQEKDNYITY